MSQSCVYQSVLSLLWYNFYIYYHYNTALICIGYNVLSFCKLFQCFMFLLWIDWALHFFFFFFIFSLIMSFYIKPINVPTVWQIFLAVHFSLLLNLNGWFIGSTMDLVLISLKWAWSLIRQIKFLASTCICFLLNLFGVGYATKIFV